MNRKQLIKNLLKGIETGDPESVSVIHPDQYIQHNPQTHEGREGLLALFQRLAVNKPRVNIVRAFEDGNHVFAHTEYEFDRSRVGFEVFRFEGAHTVEHWDNIQARRGPNTSGHSMVDGVTESTDLHLTEVNRNLVSEFTREVLIGGRLNRLRDYIAPGLIEHDPESEDGLPALLARLKPEAGTELPAQRHTCHRLLAEGDFVLTVCEGLRKSEQTAFYDLFRIKDGLIAEHWNTVEKVAPRSEWKNDNGKF